MITNKLKAIFAVSIPVFILHGIEEFVTHFYDIDGHSQALFGIFGYFSTRVAPFVTFQIMFWLLLIVVLILLIDRKYQFYTLAIFGLVYIYEFHHIIKAISAGGYYSGLYTSLIFPILAIVFWKEWLKIKRQSL